MILLDTNVVSELRRTSTGRADDAVVAWIGSVDDAQLFISVLTVLELRKGVIVKQRRDHAQAHVLALWLDHVVLRLFSGRILPFDIPAAEGCAHLHFDRTRPELDAMIAATALAHGLAVATRNTRDFVGTGVRLIDPWAYRVGTGSGPA